MALVKSLNYASNKPISASGKPEILRFRSDNSEYKSGDVIRIEIPTGRQGQHLFPQDSYIEAAFTVNCTSTAASSVFVDGSAYSFFKRLRVIHGSSVLEDTLYSNRLWNALYDVQRNEIERSGDKVNLLVYGQTPNGNSLTKLDAIGAPADQAALVTILNNRFVTINENNAVVTANLKSKSMLGRQITTTNANNTDYPIAGAIDFTFVLPSAVLGCLAQKALPLSLCGASSLYLELELESASQVFSAFDANVVTGINSYTLKNIYYNAKVTQLPYDIEKLVIESTGGIINLPATGYKGELKSIVKNATTFNDKFSFQHSSVKNFLFFMQNSASANGALGALSLTQRPRVNLSEWNLLINGEAFPSQTINTLSKMYTELLRSYDMLTDSNAGGILDYDCYNAPNGADENAQKADDVYATLVFKRFLAGVDMDRYNHSSDTLMSGTNTIGNTINLNCLLNCLTDSNLYAYVQYDVNIKLQGGLLQAMY